MHAKLRADDHIGIAHIVARIAQIGKADALQPSEMLADRQHIGQHLRRMELIGKAVPDRHAGVLCQFLDDGLAEAAVLDPLEHPSQHPRGVLDALLLPDLGAGRVKIGRPHPQIMGRHLKGAAGPGAGLLEDQRHIPAFKRIDALMMLLSVLQKRSEIQKIHDLLRRKILQCQKIPSAQTVQYLHVFSLLTAVSVSVPRTSGYPRPSPRSAIRPGPSSGCGSAYRLPSLSHP